MLAFPAPARRFVAATLVAFVVALRPAVALAGPDWDNYDDPTDMSYLEVYMPACLNPLFAVEGNIFLEDCWFDVTWGDRTQESVRRQEVKWYERWIRSGLLFAGSLMAGIQFIRDIVQGGKDLMYAVESLIAGFDLRRPEQTAIRMADATDALNARITQAELLATSYQFEMPDDRLNKVHALVMRALAVSKDAQENAVTLSDQALGMQARLAGESGLKIVTVGGANSGQPSSNDLPPLPLDARAEDLTGLYSIGRMPMSVGSYAPEFLAAARAAAQGRAGDTSGSGMACPLEDEETLDPSVMMQRAVVMAKGAQTAATAPITHVQDVRNQIRTVNAREKEHNRLSVWQMLRRAFNMM